jgi:ATP-binding cassette subfamily B protein
MEVNFKHLVTWLKDGYAHVPYMIRALGMIWSTARGWALAWIALLVLQGLLPVAMVYLTRLVVNNLVAALDAGASWESVRPVVVSASLIGAVMLLMEILRSAINWIRTVQAELLKDHINALVQGKSVSVDLAFYDLPEYYDHLHRAHEEANYRPAALLETIGSLLQNSITLIAMGAVLIPFGPWFAVALVLSTLPALYMVLHYTLLQYQWRQHNTSSERRCWYYDWLLTSGETAAELRLFGLGNLFQSIYRANRERLRNERFQLAKQQSLSELTASAISLLISGGALMWMAWKALEKQVTLGDLALFYQALNQGQLLMRSLLENAGHLYGNSLFLKNLFEFLALEQAVKDKSNPAPAPAGLKEGIRFNQVSFSYPGSERAALRDFNLTIPAGSIVALVGQNGAGKSTFIKLLCRLYDPSEGGIEVDGIDLRDLAVNDLRGLITVMFQEPIRYYASATDNVMLGSPDSAPGVADVRAAVRAAGAEEIIARLPRGYDNLLGKWFDGGTELSVGEWQRIALARAFLREAPIILLDEPTSAMDSWAEADWFERFRRLAAGRTVIIITHRFTTAMHADIIHVMADGQIVESGRHNDLLAQGGRYAQSWAAQMRVGRGA